MQPWNKISRMPAAALQKMQDELLAGIIQKDIAPRHPHYRALFKEKGIDPASITGTAALERIPFTTKEDLLPREGERFPARHFVLEAPAVEAEPKKGGGFKLFGKKEAAPEPMDYRLSQVYYSTGRTASPVPLVLTGHDVENLKEAGVRAFDIFGLTRDDTFINAFSFVPTVSYWQMFYSTITIGSTALQTGGGRILGMEKILRALSNTEAPVLGTSPGYAQFALQTVSHFGFDLPGLERVITGNDYVPMVQVKRLQKLMEAAGTKANRVQRIYFISEALSGWAECEPDCGYHVNPDHILVEVIDPATGERKGEGEPGELVLTSLDARGTVFLRYRSGDFTTGGLTWEPCPNCGRTVPRILGDIERLSDRFVLGGGAGERAFTAAALRSFLIGREEVLQWYAEIGREGGEDRLKVICKASGGFDEAAINPVLERDLSAALGFPVFVESATLEAILNRIGMERFVTEQRIFDRRVG